MRSELEQPIKGIKAFPAILSQKRKPITETSSLLLTVTGAREPIHAHPGLTIRRDRRFIEKILEGAVTMNFARK